MSNIEKLVNKFLNNKTHITINDCDKLLTAYGYQLKKGGGSHRTYHKKGYRPVTVVAPKRTRYIYSLYVETIVTVLKLESNHDN